VVAVDVDMKILDWRKVTMRPQMLRLGAALATAVTLAAAGQQGEWRALLGPQQITKEVALSKIEESRGTILVQLEGEETCAFRNQLPRRLSDLTLQVWLLQADGTALAQQRKPSYTGWGNGGCRENPAQFWFQVSGADPVAIALRIGDQIFTQTIPGHAGSQ
jgi:hypothetical protein